MTNSGVLLHNCEGRHPRDPFVKKIAALLVPRGDEDTLRRTLSMLAEKWGEPQRVSARLPFVWTNYYEEIAPELDRLFVSYPGLYKMSDLPGWKLESCAMERESGNGAGRRVNIDPGTIDGARLLLASTKGQAHRVYLRDGIFCEVTLCLCRRKGRWESFFYTFPDFKSGVYDAWLELVREDWKREVREI